MAGGIGGDLLRGSGGDDHAASVAAFGSEVDEPVGAFDHVEIVFDDHQGVAGISESLENGEQLPDVVEVESGRRFIQDVEGVPGRS